MKWSDERRSKFNRDRIKAVANDAEIGYDKSDAIKMGFNKYMSVCHSDLHVEYSCGVRVTTTARYTRNNECVKCKAAKRDSSANQAKYRASKKKACPAWVNPTEIKEIYKQCKDISDRTDIRHHVDHIVPLQHPLVCGLHVPWNLQIIKGSDNITKSNKFNPLTFDNDNV